MNTTMNLFRLSGITLLSVLVLGSGLEAQKWKRAKYALTKGDVKVARNVAARTTAHAVKRFNLRGLVSAQKINSTKGHMYDFLKWKLGSPSAVAAQWVTANYRHFEKAYSDEAAGIMLGKKRADLLHDLRA